MIYILPALLLSGEVPPMSVPGPAAGVEIIAHRGASHDAPENTLAAVQLAWQRGADAVEVDVFLTADGRIVAIHDETTKRLAGVDRPVARQTLAELQQLDVGRWKGEAWIGERIPTLEQVLETIPDGKRVFIEIKTGPEIVPEFQRVLRAAGRPPEQTVAISFSLEAVSAVKRALPALVCCWVSDLKQEKLSRRWQPARRELVRQALAAGLDGLDLRAAPVIDRGYVDAVHAAGFELYVWTVNDADEARRLTAAGVDGLTTDRPGWLRSQLAESATAK